MKRIKNLYLKPKYQMLSLKEKFCDRVIIVLASAIRKCAVQEKFKQHLEKMEEDKIKSSKYEHIESKKDILHSAIKKIQNDSKELMEIHEVVASGLVDIRVDVVHGNKSLALKKIDKILQFYSEKLQIKKGDCVWKG